MIDTFVLVANKEIYNDVKGFLDEEQIKNIAIELKNECLIIKASFLNFNVFNDALWSFISLMTIIFTPLLAMGIIAFLIFGSNLFIDLNAVNKISFDFFSNELSVAPLYIFPQRKFSLKELSGFTVSSSTQLNFYKRFRINAKFKTGEQLILFDTNKEQNSLIITKLLNKSLST